MDSKQIQNIGESILEKYQYADSVRRKGGILPKEFLSELVDLTEAFCILSCESGDTDLSEEAESYSRITESIVTESTYHKLYESGFTNPFDDDLSTEGMNAAAMEYDTDPEEKDDELRIRRVRMWNSDTKNKIMFVNGKMIAGQHFDKGDIIERCPCQLISAKSLYSEEVRKFAFTIDYARRIYAIPFGYGTCYRNSQEYGVDGNASYYFDSSNPQFPCIVIVATKRIKKGHEIVLLSTDEDFENEIKPGQFEYNQGVEPYYAIKSARIA